MLFSFGMICWGTPFAYAQSQVSVRSGVNEDYSRLVFDWSEPSDYAVSKTEGNLIISFGSVAAIDLAKINAETLDNIGTLNVSSGAGEPLKISVQVKPESKFRHFKVGNRVIIDVYNAKGEIQKTTAVKTSSEGNVAAEEVPEQPSNESLQASENDPVVGKTPLSGNEPHVITLTNTQNVGMAAFEREGFLWMVFDDPSLKIAPVLSGPKKEDFQAFERIELPNAVAFRFPEPQGYYFYGEGGGLLWRVVMTPNPRALQPIKPQVIEDDLGQDLGGKLLWPLTEAKKKITLTDPLVGDEITVITTNVSTDFVGSKRQYVEVEILSSIVGLAYVSKADEVQATLSSDGVTISRPQGLAVSSEKDTALAVLKDDIQKEKEFFDNAEKPIKLKRIFDFDRWEMGGVRALEKNRQVLMRSITNKEGSNKVEDLLTLAKLNVANDRGAEALGLLRVAEQELPGIEENVEFIALRGVAAALAGKEDEAIRDLSHPAVQDYTETNYWRCFSLAALEDWRQADAVMPEDFTVLETYPMQIQKPLILTLAEVALRADKKNTAEELLSKLEAEFPTMSLGQRSAWKYLNGELERQKGDEEEAIANWQTLIDGKDDYYRAKAGLSLTKLQLERKKITPAKAIDRLEGLRYAWRGDELETLINYRLGEVYLQNGDYLKGFSVLRNAVSLSPNSPMGKEVTEYMTTQFRKLFIDDQSKDVSPLDLVSIYDEFKELTPIGDEGDVFVQNLAERLVEIDLLGRASDLLQHQLDHRLTGESAARVGTRLAAIQLLDNKPDRALESLKKTENALNQTVSTDSAAIAREVRLLKARALSKLNEADKALAILRGMSNDKDVNRLRADIAWNAGQWGQAASAFADLITEENISLTRPPSDYQSNLIINEAIALNLSGNRSDLDKLRERYGDVMAQSEKAKIFDLVTRPRQLGMLADKDSIGSLISEVDLFGDFLENYRKAN
ncbi:MAG: hypothetical protein R3D88_02310 [Alphaproteobacteria bacterium]|nr:hypothetical protein [Alphaproteobacteria bacterium]